MTAVSPATPLVRTSSAPITYATFVLGVLVVSFAKWGPDWPAQEYRAGLAIHNGLLAWTDQWYAGQPLPGYSVLFPPVAWVLGAAGTGLLATTVSAWLAGRLLPQVHGWARHRLGAATAITLGGNLLIGQVPFLLGTAFGLGAVLAMTLERRNWTLLLALACSAASPLAGAFLLLVMPALAARFTWRSAVMLAPALAGIGVSAAVGGAGGPFPCPWPSLVGVLVFCAAIIALTTSQDRVLRRFAVLYAVAGVLCFIVPNPIGGNVTRLGKLIALPLACCLISPDQRRRLLRFATATIAAVCWPLVPVITAAAHGARDPSQQAAFYRGLLGYLKTQDPAEGRLEIPFTREHWETAWVAPEFPIARGWERQTDLAYNAVLYRPISATAYKQWLDDNAVRLIALPHVALDDGGKAEAAVLTHPPSYLRAVWSDADWTVWRVIDARPMIAGPASITAFGPASFRAHFTRPGTAVVRIRASRMWEMTAGHGCLTSTPDGWLVVRSSTPGDVTVRARLNMQLITGGSDCD
jgi:MFS family permease